MKRPEDLKRARNAAIIVLTLLILFQTQDTAKGSTFFYLPVSTPANVNTPLVILNNVTLDSTIYANSTSARVIVAANKTALDILEITNQTNDAWQLQLLAYDGTNINYLSNCTIWFHNESTSVQIRINEGSYNQTSGGLYNLESDSRIAITAITIAQGTSYIHTFLKILHPETSTYFLYAITFEIAS